MNTSDRAGRGQEWVIVLAATKHRLDIAGVVTARETAGGRWVRVVVVELLEQFLYARLQVPLGGGHQPNGKLTCWRPHSVTSGPTTRI
jgi:hypothetical protein